MRLSERINKKFGTSEPIPGFKVMEWLRGVRDENYRLSIENPEARKKQKEEARRRLEEKARKTGRKIIEV